MTKPPRLCLRAVEFRATEQGDGRTLEGYAAVFDTPTRIDSWEGKFDEEIAKGAFAKTIKERSPVLQFDHGHDMRTGSVPIGAIEQLKEDATGLFVRARLFDNQVVEPIRQAIEGGAIDGMSFRFRVTREEWNEEPDIPVRTIREVELFELGPVVFPAYEATSVGVRSILAGLDEDERRHLIRELARELRIAHDLSDAGEATSDTPDAAPQGTSGLTPDQRSAQLRGLKLRKAA